MSSEEFNVSSLVQELSLQMLNIMVMMLANASPRVNMSDCSSIFPAQLNQISLLMEPNYQAVMQNSTSILISQNQKSLLCAHCTGMITVHHHFNKQDILIQLY